MSTPRRVDETGVELRGSSESETKERERQLAEAKREAEVQAQREREEKEAKVREGRRKDPAKFSEFIKSYIAEPDSTMAVNEGSPLIARFKLPSDTIVIAPCYLEDAPAKMQRLARYIRDNLDITASIISDDKTEKSKDIRAYGITQHTYPEIDARTDAPTGRTFCVIMIQPSVCLGLSRAFEAQVLPPTPSQVVSTGRMDTPPPTVKKAFFEVKLHDAGKKSPDKKSEMYDGLVSKWDVITHQKDAAGQLLNAFAIEICAMAMKDRGTAKDGGPKAYAIFRAVETIVRKHSKNMNNPQGRDDFFIDLREQFNNTGSELYGAMHTSRDPKDKAKGKLSHDSFDRVAKMFPPAKALGPSSGPSSSSSSSSSRRLSNS